jgi:hypothetical protein
MPAVHAAAAQEKTVHMAVVMTATGEIKATGDVAFDGPRPRMTLTMLSGGHKLGMRFVDGQCYLQVPGVLPAGKFVAVDPNDKSTIEAKTCTILFDQMVPLVDLETMKSAVQKVERVGKQKMDGVTVEHYKVLVATASILHERGYAPDADKMPDTIEYHYWIDGKHLTHRRFYKTPDMDFDARMSRWGEPVEIQRPTNGQVMTMPEA